MVESTLHGIEFWGTRAARRAPDWLAACRCYVVGNNGLVHCGKVAVGECAWRDMNDINWRPVCAEHREALKKGECPALKFRAYTGGGFEEVYPLGHEWNLAEQQQVRADRQKAKILSAAKANKRSRDVVFK